MALFRIEIGSGTREVPKLEKKPAPTLLGFYHALAVNDGALPVSTDVRETMEANIMIQLLWSPSGSVLLAQQFPTVRLLRADVT